MLGTALLVSLVYQTTNHCLACLAAARLGPEPMSLSPTGHNADGGQPYRTLVIQHQWDTLPGFTHVASLGHDSSLTPCQHDNTVATTEVCVLVMCAVMSGTVLLMSLLVEHLWDTIPGSPYFASPAHVGVTALILCVGALLAFMMVWVEFTVIAQTSALTFMVAGTFKEVVTGSLLPLSSFGSCTVSQPMLQLFSRLCGNTTLFMTLDFAIQNPQGPG